MIKEPVSAEVFQQSESLSQPQQAKRLCVECQAPVSTRYCGHCGRKVYQSSVLMDTAVHTAQVLMNIDGRWRRTLRDLFLRPGYLLTRYLSGDRHLYANPVLMLLVLTSLSVLLMELLQADFNHVSDDQRLIRLMQWLVMFSGYLAVVSNIVVAWLSRRFYPTTKWPERFIVLSYASAFSTLIALPLMLLAYFLGHDLTNTYLTWLSILAGSWIIWSYQGSIKRTLAMLVLSFVVFMLFVFLISFTMGIYVSLEADLSQFRELPQLFSQAPIY